MSIETEIQTLVTQNPVVLFMKGTPDFPQCGFSGRVVSLLRQYTPNFLGVNVLEDNELREAIKVFSQWPTLPQLYVNGEFIGGCDIVNELYEQGQLEAILTGSSQ